MITKDRLQVLKAQYQPLAPNNVYDLIEEVERLQIENDQLKAELVEKDTGFDRLKETALERLETVRSENSQLHNQLKAIDHALGGFYCSVYKDRGVNIVVEQLEKAEAENNKLQEQLEAMHNRINDLAARALIAEIKLKEITGQ